MNKVSVKSLQAELTMLKKNYDDSRLELSQARSAASESAKQTELARGQFADLKKRLHDSETEVARLTGYLARVREDDVVREELISTGDPEGGQRLVPKRKPEYLGNREPNMTDFCEPAGGGYGGYRDRDRPKPKHWIEY